MRRRKVLVKSGGLRRAIVVGVVVWMAYSLLPPATTASASPTQVVPGSPVVLAHYYIWFEPTSWNRAKIDYPALGRYSSDQESVMREHIALAKSVGIDGFIVSWKSTEVLDPRLERLINLAEEADFKLAITYQGLDFNRDPLPPTRIGDDLDFFVEHFADRQPFDLFDKPLVVWSGTWEFDVKDIDAVVSARATSLHVLASEKSIEGYLRVADVVDGNLYYWSSVNPETFPGYPKKLIDMGNEVRQHGGIWIAPVAPGFDARLVGGTTVVDRENGETMREQWNGALASVPHAIGIISWNEFSENTHIEPSQTYGSSAVEVIADLTGAPVPTAVDFDSSSPQGPPETESQIMRYVALAGFVGLMGVSLLVIGRRRRLSTRLSSA